MSEQDNNGDDLHKMVMKGAFEEFKNRREVIVVNGLCVGAQLHHLARDQPQDSVDDAGAAQHGVLLQSEGCHADQGNDGDSSVTRNRDLPTEIW